MLSAEFSQSLDLSVAQRQNDFYKKESKRPGLGIACSLVVILPVVSPGVSKVID